MLLPVALLPTRIRLCCLRLCNIVYVLIRKKRTNTAQLLLLEASVLLVFRDDRGVLFCFYLRLVVISRSHIYAAA